MTDERPFAALAADFLREELAASPVMASNLGLIEFDAELDDLAEAAFAHRRRRSETWLRAFEATAEGRLCPAEQIDRTLVVSVLRGRQIMADWEMWRRQPDIYLGPPLAGVFGLFLHRLRAENELVDAACARLRAVPSRLADGKRNLVPELTPRVYVDRALGQARAAARYAREVVASEARDPAARALLAEAGAQAAAAFDDFAMFLVELAPKASGGWAIGHERYSHLLRDKELVEADAVTLRRRGEQEYERLAEDLRQRTRDLAGHEEWPRLLAELHRDHPATPEAMRTTYVEWTERARRFLHERDLVSFPAGEECSVEPSPLFQRPVLAVASYHAPPAFTPSRRGHFFVPFPPDGASAEEISERLQNNSFASIPTTAVHEAYPGHHWHLVTAKENPSLLRRTFRTAYFAEGWALYAEEMMREQGFFAEPRQALAQVESMLFRAARIVVDTSLHLGEMTHEAAVRFMRERANLPEPTAKAEVSRYCSWPTQASAYLTGCLEILAMRTRYLSAHGSRPQALRDFHDRLARTGCMPPALAERALEGDA